MPRCYCICGCLLSYGILFQATAVGQVTCRVSASAPATVRAQGLAELAGDLVIECTGQSSATMFVDWTVIVNTYLASRTFGSARSEALLLIDDPVNPVLGEAGKTGGNVFTGISITVSNRVQWVGVPFAPIGVGGRRLFRIKNIRVNASGIASGGSGTPGQVLAFISASGPFSMPLNNPQQILGFVQQGLTFSVRNGSNPNQPLQGVITTPPSLAPGPTPAAYLRFIENFPTAFRTRGTSTQTAPGISTDDYGTESGYTFGIALLQTTGLADFGTRLTASFANIPRGVHVWVGLSDRSGRARLTASEDAAFQAVSSQVTVGGVAVAEVPSNNGAGSVVWEVLAADQAATDTFDFPVFLAAEGEVGDGSGTVTGRLGPYWTGYPGSTTAPLPRFQDAGTAVAFVEAPPFSVSCSSTEGPARVGVPYSVECTAARGKEPYNWSIQGGDLPRGLGQSAATGATIKIEGTPTTAGPYSYRVAVNDSSLPAQTASMPYSGVIGERLASEIPGSASAIAVGGDGSVYIIGTTSCNAGGCPPYRWNGSAFQRIDTDGSGTRIAVDSTGRLWLVNKLEAIYRYASATSEASAQIPGGASDVAAGGGSVYVVGNVVCDAAGCAPYLYTGTTFQQMQGSGARIAADSSGLLWMVDNNRRIYRYRSTAAGVSPDQVPGEATAVAASADGAVYIVGTAPCDGNGCTVARFNGTSFTPIAGLTAVEIAADRNGVLWLVTKTGQIMRYPPGEPMRVTCNPAAGPTTAGIPYSTTCTVSAGQAPFQWSISEGALPTGLSLNAAGASATLSGTPSATGAYRFTVSARDSYNPPRIAGQTFSGTVGAPPTPVTVSCTPAAGPTTAGVGYSTTCTAAGGIAPYSWSIASGTLPAGLKLSANTGASISIFGTLTGSGAYDFTVLVRDSGSGSASQRFSGTIAALTNLAVNCVPGVGPSVVGAACSETCTATGGIPPYNWSISQGRLPDGLALTATAGATISISGTPSVSGQFAFTLSVTDSGTPPQNATRSFSGTLPIQQFRAFNAASFGEGTVAAESIVSLFGSGLALRAELSGDSVVTTLGGCTVRVTDSKGVGRDAQLFFASSGQVNLLMPAGTAAGVSSIMVNKPGLLGVLFGSVVVADVAPGIFVVSGGSSVPAAFYLRVTPANQRIQDYTFNPATLEAVNIPRDSGDAIYLLLYGTGFRRNTGNVTATANGRPVPVLGALAQGQFAGLDQVNIGPLPPGLPSGLVTVRIVFDGLPANDITVRLQ